MKDQEQKPRYKKPESVKALERMIVEENAKRYPNFPASYIPRTKMRDDTANGLTQCILKFITLKGGQAERINTTGRVVMRHTQQLRGGKLVDTANPQYIPTSGARGSADISATIGGRSVKIEVKIRTDRQRPEQKQYQQAVEQAGGLYYIAKDFTGFVGWYNSNFS